MRIAPRVPCQLVNVKMSSVSSRSTPPTSRLKRKRDPSSDSSSSLEPERTEEVAVLSHAAKRKQKKALLKEAVPSGSPTTKKEGDASRPVKRENSIWVGNLCYKTTPESLRRFFDGVGEITRVHLPTKLGKASPGDPARRENRGCGSIAAISHASFLLIHSRQVCLCGFRDARGQEYRYLDDRVASGRTPPSNQGRCVHLIRYFVLLYDFF